MEKTEFGEIHLTHKQTVDLIQGLADRTINLVNKYSFLQAPNHGLLIENYFFNAYMYRDKNKNERLIGYVSISNRLSGWKVWIYPASARINRNYAEFNLDFPEDNYAHTSFNMVNVIDDFHRILDKVELRMHDEITK